jgi:hypothetical protein
MSKQIQFGHGWVNIFINYAEVYITDPALIADVVTTLMAAQIKFRVDHFPASSIHPAGSDFTIAKSDLPKIAHKLI